MFDNIFKKKPESEEPKPKITEKPQTKKKPSKKAKRTMEPDKTPEDTDLLVHADVDVKVAALIEVRLDAEQAGSVANHRHGSLYRLLHDITHLTRD